MADENRTIFASKSVDSFVTSLQVPTCGRKDGAHLGILKPHLIIGILTNCLKDGIHAACLGISPKRS